MHVGYVIPNYMHYQSHYHHTICLFSSPFVTCLLRGMGMMEAMRGMTKVIIPVPLGLHTLWAMRLVRHLDSRDYVLNNYTNHEDDYDEAHPPTDAAFPEGLVQPHSHICAHLA